MVEGLILESGWPVATRQSGQRSQNTIGPKPL